MIPLSMVAPGEPAVVGKITGKDAVRQHLAGLGFVMDATVSVVSRVGGSVIDQVQDSRIALGAAMANRIFVKS